MYVHMSVRVCELLYLYVHLVMCGSVYICAVCVCVCLLVVVLVVRVCVYLCLSLCEFFCDCCICLHVYGVSLYMYHACV